jgi:hypothetical protein
MTVESAAGMGAAFARCMGTTEDRTSTGLRFFSGRRTLVRGMQGTPGGIEGAHKSLKLL